MVIIIGGKNKKEITNIETIYFAEDGKLDVCFNDGRESIWTEKSTPIFFKWVVNFL